jgi:hypothetical protein
MSLVSFGAGAVDCSIPSKLVRMLGKTHKAKNLIVSKKV